MTIDKPALLGGCKTLKNELLWNNSFGDQEVNAAIRVIQSGKLSDFYGSPGDRFLGGKEIKNFERQWSEFFKVEYSVSVNSATSALFCAVGALDLKPGDEVIVPPWTMSATVMAIAAHGAVPIFADIEKDFFTIDPQAIAKKINARTKAIIAVNLFGQSCEFRGILELCQQHDLYLIEDNAQAPAGTFGNQFLGTVGDIGIFSLNCHKAIQCGEGGMAVTADKELAYRMQLIRNHGENVVSENDGPALKRIIGHNFRMTEIQAAIAAEQLKKLNQVNEYKIHLIEGLNRRLESIEFLKMAPIRAECKHVFYLDTALYDESVLGISRSRFVEYLRAEGFKCVGGYVRPLYRLPFFANYEFQNSVINYKDVHCPVVENYDLKEFMYLDIIRHKVDAQTLDLFLSSLHKFEKFAHELK